MLENIIDKYFIASNNYDEQGLRNCFSGDAILYDEGKQLIGNQSIAKHINDANNNDVQVEIVSRRDNENQVIVGGEVKGSFGTILLDFNFKLKDGLISELSITDSE